MARFGLFWVVLAHFESFWLILGLLFARFVLFCGVLFCFKSLFGLFWVVYTSFR